MKKGVLFVVSGPSATGKGTICKELLKDSALDLVLSISATTRAPREGEIEGVSYLFKTKEQFLQMIDRDELIEYAQVYDNYYGTPKESVFEQLQQGKSVILEIDTQGALNIQKKFPDSVLIFLMPPSVEELRNRICRRGTENEAAIEKRLRCACAEMACAKEYNYTVVNDDLNQAIQEMKKIIQKEQRCTSR